MTTVATVRHLLGIASFVALSVPACQRGSVVAEQFPGYPHVLAAKDCPPAGRHAVSVVFRPRPDSLDAVGPQLHVAIWRDVQSLAGRTFTSADRPSTGGGYECTDAATCSPLRAWRVRFGSIAQDSAVVGELEVGGDQRPSRRGRFRAVWRSRVVYCI
jgi:hypothetical protein